MWSGGVSNPLSAIEQLTYLLFIKRLDDIVSMPSGVFKPYAGVSTAILFFTKTNSGGTDHVWFYDMQADGYSLDDKRAPAVNDELRSKNEVFKVKKNGANLPEYVAKDNLPDIIARWQSLQSSSPGSRDSALAPQSTSRNVKLQRTTDARECSLKLHATYDETTRKRTDQSFLVPKAEIAANDYDLSINRYKEVEYEAVEYAAPKNILASIAKLDAEIETGRKELEGML